MVANLAQVFDATNPPDATQLSFSTTATLPLDFENDTYMAFAGDNCEEDVGTNSIYFVVNKAQYVSSVISDPSNGRVVSSNYFYVPGPQTVPVAWNFTMADGVTPYTNDSYASPTPYPPAATPGAPPPARRSSAWW